MMMMMMRTLVVAMMMTQSKRVLFGVFDISLAVDSSELVAESLLDRSTLRASRTSERVLLLPSGCVLPRHYSHTG